ncbi:MAG TPA: nitrate reductase [Opitutaceae bacterium]|nr:nitrate reductase [Opitutaceae bacterium]
MTKLRDILRARSGPMTAEMVLHPADFGLGRVPARLRPAATTSTVCGFCSTGCGLKVHLGKAGDAINVSADPDYPVNLGMACPKGWEALTPLAAPDRATTPLLRAGPGADLAPVSWDQAMRAFTDNLQRIQREHGPGAIAFLSTGQIVTEEIALLGALFKFGMGGVHCDSNTRQCMATSHVAYKQAFGFDAPPYTYADFEESDALIFIGSNPCIAHPIMWQRVMRNRRRPEIVVLDPRATETAQAATLHVALRPKTDLTLLYGLAHRLIERGQIDRAFIEAHTAGFEAFATFVRAFTPDRVAAETGVPIAVLDRLADIFKERERVSLWWTMGVNQSHEGTRTAQAIIALALMTGNIGRPGTGANSITGQCNAMGSRLFANATSLIGGYDLGNAAHRAHVGRVLGIDPGRIPEESGYAYDQILDAVERGEIRGLWVIATNTAHSWINQSRARAILERLEFLVVQDMYANTETAQLAHLVLPAAGWGEKDGVFINSERRLARVRKVARAPGQALSDFAIFQLVASAWGCGGMFERWRTPEAAFEILKELSRGQPYDFTGIHDYAHLEAAGGIQWPLPAADAAGELRNADCGMRNGQTRATDNNAASPQSGAEHDLASHSAIRNPQSAIGTSAIRTPHSAIQERRLFADGRFFTPDGRARFLFDPPRPLPEPPDKAYPFLLLTGRGTSAQWHTGSRTNKSSVLRKLAPTRLTVELNPHDATRLGLASGDRVRVRSRRGRVEAIAVVTATIPIGQVFLPMHFAAVNQLTFAAFDPYSRQPAYKGCAVAVERGE